MVKRFIAVGLLSVLSLGLFSGCVRKNQGGQQTQKKIELVYYKLFDEEDVMMPLIQKYQREHPNITIRYRKFTDPEEYENLIINELAEGEGPDIFSAPNYWFLRHYKKIAPLPPDMMSAQQFDQTFVSVASSDLTLTDPVDHLRKVYGIPLTVDTLALYYNKALFEDAIASRGRPAATWEQLKEDVFRLTKKDNSFERFEVAGIAMGRSDNILRAIDILYLLMLQYKTDFYNDTISKAVFSSQKVTGASGPVTPAAEALKLYTGFALPANKNYSWNSYLVPDPNSPVKELEPFAKGKVAMVFGYSYLYQQLKDQIQDLKGKGVQTIDPNDIGISIVPQVNDPQTTAGKRIALASYYAETVARTSQYSREAWDFLRFISSKENLQQYLEKTHRPTSRRDMIEQQKQDPIYGVFAEQIGFAESFPIYDQRRYREIFSRAVDAVLATTSPEDAIKTSEANINVILPPGGLGVKSEPPKAGNTSGQAS